MKYFRIHWAGILLMGLLLMTPCFPQNASGEPLPRTIMPDNENEKDANLAFLYSFLVPGLGQYYVGDGVDVTVGIFCDVFVVSGAVVLVCFPSGTGINAYGQTDYTGLEIGLGLGLGGWVSSMIFAPMEASQHNDKLKELKHKSFGDLLEFPVDKYSLGINVGLLSRSEFTTAMAYGPKVTAALHF